MRNEDKDIDKLFRRGLADPVNETGYREDDWDALDQLMDKGKKRRGIVFWLPIISSVAAILLLMLGWWLFKPQVGSDAEKNKQQIVVIKHPTKQEPVADNTNLSGKENIITNKQATSLPAAHQPIAISSNEPVNNLAKTTTTNHGNMIMPSKNNYIPVGLTSNNQPGSRNATDLVAVNTGVNIDAGVANRQYISTATVAQKEIANNGYVKMIAAKRNAIVTQSSFKRPQFALTVMGAPEINGVSSFQQGKAGTNVGLLFSVGINKLTVSTGATYSAKPYNTSFDNYHSTNYTFRTDPTDVVADCRVIDIPLNVDYQLYNKHQNKFSVGTGISSYLMMHESYKYDYADPSIRGPRNYAVASPGNYLFGVLNLQATYQRQVNSKVGVSVQPYLKLPLTSIGASQVKLQSAGVAIGLSWNINSLTKP